MWHKCCKFAAFKRNQIAIALCGDLRLKITKLKPQIKHICNQHQSQSLHNIEQ